MRRLAALTYGVVSYAIFFGTFLYAIAWLGDFGISNTIDSAPQKALGVALLIDLGLLAQPLEVLFFLLGSQHRQ